MRTYKVWSFRVIETMAFAALAIACSSEAGERANYSIDDMIEGFKQGDLNYFEMYLTDSGYQKTMNKCLDSRPAEYSWMKEFCGKHPEFKNAFICREAGDPIHIYFVYSSKTKCEELRAIMKDKMDAMK